MKIVKHYQNQYNDQLHEPQSLIQAVVNQPSKENKNSYLKSLENSWQLFKKRHEPILMNSGAPSNQQYNPKITNKPSGFNQAMTNPVILSSQQILSDTLNNVVQSDSKAAHQQIRSQD